MDLIYNIQQIGANLLLFNYTVNKTVPVFTIVFTNPWTAEEKILSITHDGTDGEWILSITGIAQAYEDLSSGQIYLSLIGTWPAAVKESGTLIKTINLQVV